MYREKAISAICRTLVNCENDHINNDKLRTTALELLAVKGAV